MIEYSLHGEGKTMEMGAEREKISVVFCARVKVVLNVVKTDGNLIVKMRTESWGCECGWTRERERESEGSKQRCDVVTTMCLDGLSDRGLTGKASAFAFPFRRRRHPTSQ